MSHVSIEPDISDAMNMWSKVLIENTLGRLYRLIFELLGACWAVFRRGVRFLDEVSAGFKLVSLLGRVFKQEFLTRGIIFLEILDVVCFYV